MILILWFWFLQNNFFQITYHRFIDTGMPLHGTLLNGMDYLSREITDSNSFQADHLLHHNIMHYASQYSSNSSIIGFRQALMPAPPSSAIREKWLDNIAAHPPGIKFDVNGVNGNSSCSNG